MNNRLDERPLRGNYLGRISTQLTKAVSENRRKNRTGPLTDRGPFLPEKPQLRRAAPLPPEARPFQKLTRCLIACDARLLCALADEKTTNCGRCAVFVEFSFRSAFKHAAGLIR